MVTCGENTENKKHPNNNTAIAGIRRSIEAPMALKTKNQIQMKNSTFNAIIFSLIVLLFSIAAFQYGYAKGQRESFDVSKASDRYFEAIGNPATQDEQCIYDYVIYGDREECNNN